MGQRNLRSGAGRPGASAIRGMNQGREGQGAGIGYVKDEAQKGDEAAIATAAEQSADLQAAAAALDGGPVRLASLATWHSCVTLLFCDIVVRHITWTSEGACGKCSNAASELKEEPHMCVAF